MANRNVLLRMRNQGFSMPPKPTETKPIILETTISSKNKHKYNPDVMERYNQEKNDIVLKDIQYTNKTWKGVTGDEMNFKVDCSSSFIIEMEEIDHEKILSDYDNEFNKREKERIEIERINLEIKEKMMENVMIMTDAICNDNGAEDTLNFDELKISTDINKTIIDQDNYNALLDEINKL